MAVLDWTNPDDYKYTEELTLHQWAWEFLRRNKEYRSRYLAMRLGEDNRWTDESQDELVRIGRKFGLLRVFHPEARADEVDVVWSIGAGVHLLWDPPNPGIGNLHHAQPPWPGYPFGLALIFDLRQSIKLQVESAERMLRDYRQRVPGDLPKPRKATKRQQPGKFPTYIRALDGSATRASYAAIGKVLFPEADDLMGAEAVRALGRESKNAEYAVKSGEKLRDGDYRELLYRPDI